MEKPSKDFINLPEYLSGAARKDILIRSFIIDALTHTGGNMTKAAMYSGYCIRTIRNYLQCDTAMREEHDRILRSNGKKVPRHDWVMPIYKEPKAAVSTENHKYISHLENTKKTFSFRTASPAEQEEILNRLKQKYFGPLED